MFQKKIRLRIKRERGDVIEAYQNKIGDGVQFPAALYKFYKGGKKMKKSKLEAAIKAFLSTILVLFLLILFLLIPYTSQIGEIKAAHFWILSLPQFWLAFVLLFFVVFAHFYIGYRG
jgi:uncharacterized membrane protein YbhN (UPF0104 family)